MTSPTVSLLHSDPGGFQRALLDQGVTSEEMGRLAECPELVAYLATHNPDVEGLGAAAKQVLTNRDEIVSLVRAHPDSYDVSAAQSWGRQFGQHSGEREKLPGAFRDGPRYRLGSNSADSAWRIEKLLALESAEAIVHQVRKEDLQQMSDAQRLEAARRVATAPLEAQAQFASIVRQADQLRDPQTRELKEVYDRDPVLLELSSEALWLSAWASRSPDSLPMEAWRTIVNRLATEGSHNDLINVARIFDGEGIEVLTVELRAAMVRRLAGGLHTDIREEVAILRLLGGEATAEITERCTKRPYAGGDPAKVFAEWKPDLAIVAEVVRELKLDGTKRVIKAVDDHSAINGPFKMRQVLLGGLEQTRRDQRTEPAVQEILRQALE